MRDTELKAFSVVPERRQCHPTPVLLPGKSHGRRSLVGCSPWGLEESDTTERLHFHFLLSCIGGENGNPLQCSCLDNPRYGGAQWAAVCGVAQSWTRLKRLSSSSSRRWVMDGNPSRFFRDEFRHDWSLDSLRNNLVIRRWPKPPHLNMWFRLIDLGVQSHVPSLLLLWFSSI